MKVTAIQSPLKEQTPKELLAELKTKTVTLELSEFDLAILGRLAVRVGGRSEAREVFSPCSEGRTELGLSAATKIYFTPEKWIQIREAIDQLYQFDTGFDINNKY